MEDQGRILLTLWERVFSARKSSVAERRTGRHGQLENRASAAGYLSNVEDEGLSLLEKLHRGDGCLQPSRRDQDRRAGDLRAAWHQPHACARSIDPAGA